jgi:putative ABC transport system permease protein
MRSAFQLAWRQLSDNGWRLLAAAAGVAFAVVLMLVQNGLLEALFTSVTKLYASAQADLVLISPLYQSQLAAGSFPRHRLYHALAVAGVRRVVPLYLGDATWRNPLTRSRRDISIVAFRPQRGLFDLPGVDEGIPSILFSDSVLFDRGSRPEYGPVPELLARRPVETEIGGRHNSVRGLFFLGASFASDGTVLTSDMNFFRIEPGQRSDQVSLGFVFLDRDAPVEAVRTQIRVLVGNDVQVLTRQELVDKERAFWNDSLPIGFVLSMNMVLGLIIGTVIVYQILYTAVVDSLSKYATLKALGYPDAYLHLVVLDQALILSILGFIPGYLSSLVVYAVTQHLALLPLRMTALRTAGVYSLTLLMCALGGTLATRKLRLADPADIF